MSGPERRVRPVVRFVGWILLIAIPVVPIASIELAGWAYLRTNKLPTQPLFYDRNQPEDTVEKASDKRWFMSTLDPHLSHAQELSFLKKYRSIPGFIIYGADAETAQLRIVAIGGSTTAPLTDHNWPQELATILVEHNISAHVYNGGAAGYSSNQELLKFIRDVEPLHPDIVISYSGVNDLGGVHYSKDHPMVHPYQQRIFNAIVKKQAPPPALFPNAVTAVHEWLGQTKQATLGFTMGPPNPITPADQWVRNEKMMQVLSAAFGIRMLTVLQPTMGTGAYSPSDAEKEMFTKAIDRYQKSGKYPEMVASFYDGVRSKLDEIPNAVDMTNIFADKQNMFRDARHQSGAGRKAVAQAVYDELERRGWLEPSR